MIACSLPECVNLPRSVDLVGLAEFGVERRCFGVTGVKMWDLESEM